MRTALALSVALVTACSATAQVSIGGAQSLYVQPSARAAGMGHCTVAVLDDADACSWNPGGLPFIEGNLNIAAAYSQLVPDWEDVYHWHGSAAARLGNLVVGTSVAYLSYGEQYVTQPDEPDIVGSFESYEFVPSVAFGLAVGENIGVGANVKYVKVKLAPPEYTVEGVEGEGSAFGVDLGAEFRMRVGDGPYGILIRTGGVLQNVGSRISYVDEEQSDPLPRNVKFGASGQLSYGAAGRALACAQYEAPLLEGSRVFDGVLGAGLELEFSLLGLYSAMENAESPEVRDLIAVRVGYVSDDAGEIHGFSYGFGLGGSLGSRVQARLDYAKVPQAEGLTEPWRIGGSGWVVF